MKTKIIAVLMFAVFSLYAEEPVLDIHNKSVQSVIKVYKENALGEAYTVKKDLPDILIFLLKWAQEETPSREGIMNRLAPAKFILGKTLDECSTNSFKLPEKQEFKSIRSSGFTFALLNNETYLIVPEKVQDSTEAVARGPINNIMELGKIVREHGGLTTSEWLQAREEAAKAASDARNSAIKERLAAHTEQHQADLLKEMEARRAFWERNMGKKPGKKTEPPNYTPIGGSPTNVPSYRPMTP